MPTNNSYVAIVDDDQAIRNSLGRALKLEGYDVEQFEDGSTALRAFALRAPDALVLDLQLPDIDGLALQRRLSELGSRLPVIVMSRIFLTIY